MAHETDQDATEGGGSHSTMIRAAVAAAATGAAAYGVRRLRSSHGDEDADAEGGEEETDEGADGDEEEGDNSAGKREELTRALSTRVADAKSAASRLKPGGNSRSSVLDSAWEAASEQLLPVAKQAAASLGTTVAKKAPEVVRDELLPPFIEGLRKAT